MRKILFLLLIAPAVTAQTNYWAPQSSGTTVNLHDVFFTSRDTGFVGGDDSLLLRTYDGGVTWTTMPAVIHQSAFTQAIWMHNNNTGVLVPDFMTAVLQTTNSGQSWTPSSSQPGNPCYVDGLFFASPSEGFVYGTGCFNGCFISKWNGSTWGPDQMLWYGTRPSFEYIGIKGMAKDPVNNVYVAVGDYGKIFRSTDGFQTWDTVAYNDTTDFTAIDYVGNNTFVACSRTQTNGIYISTNGGQSFAYDANFNPTFFYPQFFDVDYAPDGFGVAVGITATSIGGFIQWASASGGWLAGGYYGTSQPINAVFTIDSTRAYAVGDNGQIYRWDIGLGLHELEQEQGSLAIYPNITDPSGQVSLTFPDNENWSVAVYNVAGQLLHQFEDLQGKKELPVNSFTNEAGVYLLRAISGKQVRTGKLIVR